ncbi:MAG: alpha/beta hydrolase [Lachnospiraceae bacterium]
MKFRTFGNPQSPHILLIHGGGNAWWNYKRQAEALSNRYHVILPTLDGHCEEFASEYRSTEDEADKILAYIDQYCGGHLFALCGVSLGGQIVMELLSRRADLTEKAIIDGSLCYPKPGMARFSMAMVKLFGCFLFGEKACRLQLKMMPKMVPEKMLYPEDIQQLYIHDMPLTPRKTMLTMYRTYMMTYTLRDSVKSTMAQVQYWYGEKEMNCVKQSAQRFKALVPSCKLYEAKNCGHGYLAIYLPEEWLRLSLDFFSAEIVPIRR